MDPKTYDDWRAVLRDPYVHFRLTLRTGERVDVRYPELCAVRRDHLSLVIPDDGELPDDPRPIRFDQIERVEQLDYVEVAALHDRPLFPTFQG